MSSTAAARPYVRHVAGGVAGTVVWSLLEPLDRRAFRYPTSDVQLLGRPFARHRAAWWPIGVALHVANGAAFGVALARLRRARPEASGRRMAWGAVAVEHLCVFPLAAAADRWHPAVRGGEAAPLFTLRGFAQETWRHALFAVILGEVAARTPAPTAGTHARAGCA